MRTTLAWQRLGFVICWSVNKTPREWQKTESEQRVPVGCACSDQNAFATGTGPTLSNYYFLFFEGRRSSYGDRTVDINRNQRTYTGLVRMKEGEREAKLTAPWDADNTLKNSFDGYEDQVLQSCLPSGAEGILAEVRINFCMFQSTNVPCASLCRRLSTTLARGRVGWRTGQGKMGEHGEGSPASPPLLRALGAAVAHSPARPSRGPGPAPTHWHPALKKDQTMDRR